MELFWRNTSGQSSSSYMCGDGVAQLVERRPQDPMDSITRGSNPVRSTRKICEFFSQKCCADSLSVCPINYHIMHIKDPVVDVSVGWITETRKCALLTEG